MLQITLGDERPVDPDSDWLGRCRVGFGSSMSVSELYEAARGCWVLGAKADGERWAVFAHRGHGVLALAIDGLVDVGDGRRAIEGTILGPGDPVHDRYVGQPAPIQGARNPVGYIRVPEDAKTCRCCDVTISSGDFAPGHDQRAIHERIARIGTVAQWCDWFDEVMPAQAVK